MPAVTHATPLISLDAVVLDIETTGLDPRKARIVEIAGLRILGGRIERAQVFCRLVDPGEAIPASTTAIHGIDAAAVAEAPPFAGVWPELSAYLGDSVVIGHSIGFDLAMLQHECMRASLHWHRPRALDTEHLARVTEPHLAGYSLDQLANWLGIDVTERHTALGDVMTTARIYQALVPKLRDGGIRTFAEAWQACRALTDVLDKQHQAGWVTQDARPDRAAAERTLSRVDSYPYRHRVRDVMSSPPMVIAEDATTGDALARLMEARISSLFVAPAAAAHAPLSAVRAGIVTERDILRALASSGDGALARPISDIASKPLASVPAEAFVYRAIGRMSRLRIRHLGVTDEGGFVVGAISARDLLRLRAGEAVSLGDEIDEARDVPALGAAWAKLPHVAESLLAEGVPARDIAAIVSRELGALTRQAAVIAEMRMRDAGQGDPPCPYAMAVLGSAGRGESLLAMDQDNALVFAEGQPDGPEDRWFAALGAHVADILNDVGVPYCKGGVMASQPKWRGSVATWRARVADWIRRSRPDDLLSVDIFFDLRGVHGQIALADALWRHAYDAARGKVEFAKLLVETSGQVEPGLTFFGGIRAQHGRIDLKRAGLFGIVSAARVLAIRHHVLERATPARLMGVRALGFGGDQDLDAMIEAHGVFVELILAQQLDDIEHGRPAVNAIATKRLSARERERLVSALRAVQHLDDLTRTLLFKG
jgi:CBS domain-containing protein